MLKNINSGFVTRIIKPAASSFFLFGPRGTGKSTWINHVFPDATVIDLLDDSVRREFLARPEKLLQQVRTLSPGSTIIIDEIQKAPELLNSVHILIEEKKRWRFVLTGSSARKLKRSGVDLLAGRALLKHLHPFIAAELGDRFNLAQAIERGLLPLVLDSSSPRENLNAYISLYMKEEVEAEGLVRNLGTFARFLETISFSHASILNLNNVARECQTTRRIVESYVHVLEDLLLAYRVPVFTKRARRAVTTHPKFYLIDSGVFQALRPAGPLDRCGDITGQALEGLVAQHLRAWTDYRNHDDRLYFWRTPAGVEVDFVMYGPDGIIGIEVKNSARIHPAELRGLENFKQDYPSAAAIMLYRGRECLREDDIAIVPCDDFLRNLSPDRSLNQAIQQSLERKP